MIFFAAIWVVVVLLTAPQIEAALATDDVEMRKMLHMLVDQPLYSFEPRADSPVDFDQQTAFMESTAPFSILLGGTGSGKTIAAAHKTARHVLFTKPHRPRCPFWIVGDTFEQVCGVCWEEKLSTIIPSRAILGFDWYKRGRNWPFAVTLRHPDNPQEPGWVLEFKSYLQGLQMMKARSIGGYWCNEEVPYPIVMEIQGRCREYDSPGWADFTPIEVVSPEWPELYENPPEGWKFFHLNTERNTYLAQGWASRYLSQLPEDMREVRRIGVFGKFSGQVFKEWQPSVNIVEPFRIPPDWHRIRGIDFGYNNPFCCLWVARDRDGRYYIYDEHYEAGRLNEYHAAAISRRAWIPDHPSFGATYSDHDAQQRSELQSLGIDCTPARKEIRAGIEALASLMMSQDDGKTRLYVFNTCKNLIREIRGYRYPTGSKVRNPTDVPLDKDNHAIDAMRYAIHSDIVYMGATKLPQHMLFSPRSHRLGVHLQRRA